MMPGTRHKLDKDGEVDVLIDELDASRRVSAQFGHSKTCYQGV